MPRLALCALILLAVGCRTVVAPAENEVDRYTVYQTIANALPRASFGFGSAPAIIGMSAAAKAEGPWPEPQPLLANEQGFRLHYEAYRPRDVWIPYTALGECSYRWRAIPNAFLIPFLVIPLQAVQAEIVVDTGKVPGLFDTILGDVRRLEEISQQMSMASPWSHAQDIKAKMNADAEAHGRGMLVVEIDTIATVPPWFPVGGEAEEIAHAFAWAAANPNAETLPEREEPAPDPGEDAGSEDP